MLFKSGRVYFIEYQATCILEFIYFSFQWSILFMWFKWIRFSLSLSLFCSPKINDMHTSGPKQQRMNKNWKWSRRRNKPQIILLPSNKPTCRLKFSRMSIRVKSNRIWISIRYFLPSCQCSVWAPRIFNPQKCALSTSVVYFAVLISCSHFSKRAGKEESEKSRTNEHWMAISSFRMSDSV